MIPITQFLYFAPIGPFSQVLSHILKIESSILFECLQEYKVMESSKNMRTTVLKDSINVSIVMAYRATT